MEQRSTVVKLELSKPHTATSPLIGLVVRRKASGEVFEITGREDAFALLNGGAFDGGRHVLLSELSYYEAVESASNVIVLKAAA